MNRRLTSLVILGLGALWLAGLAIRPAYPTRCEALRRSMSIAARAVARAGAIAIHAVARQALPTPAMAQQVLDFKPVPRESVSRFERMRVQRHPRAQVDSIIPPDPAEEPDAADRPDEPETPAVPSPPGIVDRSGSIMRIGSDIHVGKDEVIEGDLSSVSGDITIAGHVEGDVVAMKGDVLLKSTARVDGDVVCLGGTLTEEPGAQVSGQKVTAPVHGFRHGRFTDHERSHDMNDHVAGSLVWLLVLLFFGWMFARFLEHRTLAAVETLKREPGLSLGIGSLVWALLIPSVIALALVVALLCITLIGIPLALAALVGYVLFIAVLTVWGFAVGAAFLGGGLSRRPAAPMAGAVAPDEPARHSAMRAVMMGVIALAGAKVVGRLLQSVGDIGPLHGLGTLIVVLSVMTCIVAMTAGAGALLRNEIISGTFQRFVLRRRNPVANGGHHVVPPVPPVPPVTPVPSVPPIPPVSPTPPSPPSAFEPPTPPAPPPAPTA